MPNLPHARHAVAQEDVRCAARLIAACMVGEQYAGQGAVGRTTCGTGAQGARRGRGMHPELKRVLDEVIDAPQAAPRSLEWLIEQLRSLVNGP